MKNNYNIWEDHAKWERAVIDQVIKELDITNGDAQSLIEANEHIFARCFIRNTNPKETAKLLIEASKSVK